MFLGHAFGLLCYRNDAYCHFDLLKMKGPAQILLPLLGGELDAISIGP